MRLVEMHNNPGLSPPLCCGELFPPNFCWVLYAPCCYKGLFLLSFLEGLFLSLLGLIFLADLARSATCVVDLVLISLVLEVELLILVDLLLLCLGIKRD